MYENERCSSHVQREEQGRWVCLGGFKGSDRKVVKGRTIRTIRKRDEIHDLQMSVWKRALFCVSEAEKRRLWMCHERLKGTDLRVVTRQRYVVPWMFEGEEERTWPWRGCSMKGYRRASLTPLLALPHELGHSETRATTTKHRHVTSGLFAAAEREEHAIKLFRYTWLLSVIGGFIARVYHVLFIALLSVRGCCTYERGLVDNHTYEKGLDWIKWHYYYFLY